MSKPRSCSDVSFFLGDVPTCKPRSCSNACSIIVLPMLRPRGMHIFVAMAFLLATTHFGVCLFLILARDVVSTAFLSLFPTRCGNAICKMLCSFQFSFREKQVDDNLRCSELKENLSCMNNVHHV